MTASSYHPRELSPKYGQTMANLDLKISYNNNTNTLGWKTDEEKNLNANYPKNYLIQQP